MFGKIVAPLFLVALSSCTSKNERYEDTIVVEVGSQSLTAKDFARRLTQELRLLSPVEIKDSRRQDAAKSHVINAYILEVALAELASANNLRVRPDMLNNEITNIISQYPDQLAFRRALAEENRQFDDFKRDLTISLRQRLALEHLQQVAKIKISADKIKAYYEKHKTRFKVSEAVKIQQIVVDTEDNAARILDLIKSGRDFGELAQKFSIAEEAKSHGHVAWVEKGDFEVFDASFGLAKGTVSSPLKSPFGFHIIKILEKRPAATKVLADVEKEINRELESRAFDEYIKVWLKEQLERLGIRKNDMAIASINVELKNN